jgi:hypothetical protein
MARLRRPLVPIASGALVLAACLLTACGKPPEVVPGDAALDSRVTDLEKQLRDLKDKRDSGSLAAGVAGSEVGDLRKTVKELGLQVKDLQDRLAALPAPAAAASGPSGAGPATTALPSTFDPAADGSFSESQVATFRKMMEEVDRRRTEEAQADRVRRELSRAGVNLTPEQEASVLKLQERYAAKMRELFRNGMGNNEAERQASLAQRDALRTQYENELRNVVPASDADKIVEAMRRGWPGFFPRRGGRAVGNAGD